MAAMLRLGIEKTIFSWRACAPNAGVEAQISGPWSAKLEYLYVDLGESDTVLGGQADFNTNIVRAGLNYRF